MADPSPSTAQPRISLSLTSTADVCHLSGEPRFAFKLKITLHEEDEVITVCLDKTPLYEWHGLEEIAYITDEKGKEVELPWGIACGLYDDPFPHDGCFVEFDPGVPYERTFSLDKVDPTTGGSGELAALEAGKTYKAQVADYLLRSFRNWMRGRKEELLVGGIKEKKERWKNDPGKISLEVSEPFTFKAA